MEGKDKTSYAANEIDRANLFQKLLYKAAGWIGLTSGIGLITIGGWWVIWFMISYVTMQSPQSAVQQIVKENLLIQVQLGTIVVAIGTLYTAPVCQDNFF